MSTEIIIGGRGGGKTKRCIEISSDTGAVIVCRSYEHVRYVMHLAHHMQLDIPKPISAHDFLTGQFRRNRYRGLIIEDIIELLRQHSFPIQITAISIGE